MPTESPTLARLTLPNFRKRTSVELIVLACWLRKQASDIVNQALEVSADGRYTARVIRTEKGLEAR